MDALIEKLLKKFDGDIIMLDALYQWGTTPTGSTAVEKKGYTPDHSFIESNLRIRYGDKKAEVAYKQLKEEIEALGLDFQKDFCKANNQVEEFFKDNPLLKNETIRRLKSAPDEEKYITWLYYKARNLWKDIQWERETTIGPGEKFLASIKDTFGISTTPVEVSQMLIRLGVINELQWVTGSGTHNLQHKTPKYLEDIEENIQFKLKDALAYIYIAQNIREQGVLRQNCELQYLKAFQMLSVVEENHWYGHYALRTTPSGIGLVMPLIDKRLKNSQAKIDSTLNELPERCMRYLIEHVALSEKDAGRHLISPVGYFRDDDDAIFCLLDDERLRSLRDKVFDKFVEFGLAAKANSYVSTKGRVDEQTFVLAPELKDSLFQYLNKRKSIGPIFTPQIERMHTLIHALSDQAKYHSNWRKDWTIELATRGGISLNEINDEIDKLCKDGLLALEGDELRVTNKKAYLHAIEDRFRKPIVDYLLVEQQGGLSKEQSTKAQVKTRNGFRTGKGFSLLEVYAAGIREDQIKKDSFLPIDRHRKTCHQVNLDTLEKLRKDMGT